MAQLIPLTLLVVVLLCSLAKAVGFETGRFALTALILFIGITVGGFIQRRIKYDLHKIPKRKNLLTAKDYPEKWELDIMNMRHAARHNESICINPETRVVEIVDHELAYSMITDGLANYKPEYKYARAWLLEKVYTIIFGDRTIASCSGEDWRWRRAVLGPLFHTRKMLPTLLPYVVSMAKNMGTQLYGAEGKTVEVDQLFTEATLSIIFKYLTGENRDDVDKAICAKNALSGNLYRRAYKSVVPLILSSAVFGFTSKLFMTSDARRSARDLHKYCTSVVDYIITKQRTNDERDQSILVKMSQEPGYDYNTAAGKSTLIAELNIMLFAGHDTTGHSLGFIFYELGSRPDLQQRVFQEVRSALGLPGKENEVTADVIGRLPTLSAVIRETLRYYMIAPSVAMSANGDVILGKYKLPDKTTVMINLTSMSHDTRYFEEPDVFNPDRWLNEDAAEFFADAKTVEKKKRTNIDVAFLYGAHSCLGRNLALLELRVITSLLVNKFELSVPKDFKLVLSVNPLVKPELGTMVTFTPRV